MLKEPVCCSFSEEGESLNESVLSPGTIVFSVVPTYVAFSNFMVSVKLQSPVDTATCFFQLVASVSIFSASPDFLPFKIILRMFHVLELKFGRTVLVESAISRLT